MGYSGYGRLSAGSSRAKGYPRKVGFMPKGIGAAKRRSDGDEKQRKYASTSILRGPSGFPDRIKVKLTYYDQFQFTISLGLAGLQQFRGNSVFDPDFTGGGHQPTAFDQWASFYGKYRVYASALRIVGVTPGDSDMAGSSSTGITVITVPSINATTSLNFTDLAQEPYANVKTSTYYTPIREMTNYLSTAKMFGQDQKAIESEDNYSALVSTNPTDVWFWKLYVLPSSTLTTNTYYYAIDVKLDYYVEFFGRNTLSTS